MPVNAAPSIIAPLMSLIGITLNWMFCICSKHLCSSGFPFCLFIAGCQDRNSQCFTQALLAGLSGGVMLLDEVTRTWTDIGAGLVVGGEAPEKRINFGFVATRGNLYVFGGQSTTGT